MDTGRCSVRLTRRYAAAPSEVWAALTEPDSLRRWLGEPEWAAVGAQTRELEPERLLVLDWRPHGEASSVVRLELTADGEGTVVVLDHSLIDERIGMAYMQRWTERLDRLEHLP